MATGRTCIYHVGSELANLLPGQLKALRDLNGDTRSRSWSRHCVTMPKGAGSISDPSGRTVALGFTACNRIEYQEVSPGE